MLYIDGLSLQHLKNELNDKLAKRKVTRVVQHTKLSFSLYFGRNNLLFTVNPKSPICYLSNSKEKTEPMNTNFILNFRKYLSGAILTEITQYSLDRILIFSFTKLNELGEQKRYKLIFEIMGKHSNAILVEDSKILELLKRFSIEENRLRLLFPGADYQYPITTEKKTIDEIDENKFNEIISSSSLIKEIEGIGKFTANSIKSYEDLISFKEKEAKPTIYFEKEKIKVASLSELNIDSDKLIHFESTNELIEYYFTNTISSEQVNLLKSKLLTTVEKAIKKNKKIIKLINRDIDKNSNYEVQKEIGDILAANLYQIKKGLTEVTLFNFYTNEDIVIKLEDNLSPKANLDRYYKKFNKLKRGYEFNFERLEKIEGEIFYLEGLLEDIKRCSTVISLLPIEEELIAEKYIKKSNKRRKAIKKSQPEMIVYEGYEIYFGKNNSENETVTFKIGGKNDIWFHVKDIPGSHVIVKTKGEKLPQEVLEKAGKISAFYSKAFAGEKIRVDYCERKFVKKIKGGKPGAVIYSNEQSVFPIKPKEL